MDVASGRVFVIVKIVSNCDIEINFFTGACKPVIIKVPSAFLQSLLPTNIALNPDESQ